MNGPERLVRVSVARRGRSRSRTRRGPGDQRPDRSDDGGDRVADGPARSPFRLPAGRVQNGSRSEAHDHGQAQRDEQEVVERAEHRDEVRDQVDRAQRVDGEEQREPADEERRARVARRVVHRERVLPQAPGSGLEDCELHVATGYLRESTRTIRSGGESPQPPRPTEFMSQCDGVPVPAA